MAKFEDLHYTEKIERLMKKIEDAKRQIAKLKRENSEYFVVVLSGGKNNGYTRDWSRYCGIGKMTLEDAQTAYEKAFANAHGAKSLIAVDEDQYEKICDLMQLDDAIELFTSKTYTYQPNVTRLIENAFYKMRSSEAELRAELGIDAVYRPLTLKSKIEQ